MSKEINILIETLNKLRIILWKEERKRKRKYIISFVGEYLLCLNKKFIQKEKKTKL